MASSTNTTEIRDETDSGSTTDTLVEFVISISTTPRGAAIRAAPPPGSWGRILLLIRAVNTPPNPPPPPLPLIRSRLQFGDRRHPYLIDDVVQITYCIGRINRFRTRLTNPSNLWVCVTLPDSASVHNISDRSFWWYTVQVPTQLTTTMSCYKAITN